MRITKVNIYPKNENDNKSKPIRLKPVKLDTAVLLDTKSNHDVYRTEDSIKAIIDKRVDDAKELYDKRENKKIICPKFNDAKTNKKFNIDITKTNILNSLLNQELPVRITDNQLTTEKESNNKYKTDITPYIKDITAGRKTLQQIFKEIEAYYKITDYNVQKYNIFLNSDCFEIKIDTASNKKNNKKSDISDNKLRLKHFQYDFKEHLKYNKSDDYFIKLANEYIYELLRSKKYKRGFNNKKNENMASNQYIISHVEGKIRNYLTQKIIQLGKGVYHFYNFKENKLKCDNITSFDYEMIKANESMTQQLYICMCFAANNLGGSIASVGTSNNILDFSEKKIDNMIITDKDIKKVNRFFGGDSANNDFIDIKDIKEKIESSDIEDIKYINNMFASFKTRDIKYINDMFTSLDIKDTRNIKDIKEMITRSDIKNTKNIKEIIKMITSSNIEDVIKIFTYLNIKEMIASLNKLRNSLFHYDIQELGDFNKSIVDEFSKFELNSFKQSLVNKYNDLKTCEYFGKQNIVNMINDMNFGTVPNAYIPNFKRINTTSVKTLFNIPLKSPNCLENQSIERESARKFLAKEIYYNKFISNDYRKKLGTDIYKNLNDMKEGEQDEKKRGAISAVIDLINDNMPFDNMCSVLQRAYVDENSKGDKDKDVNSKGVKGNNVNSKGVKGKEDAAESDEKKKKRSDNLNILLRQAVQSCFEDYLKVHYSWIFENVPIEDKTQSLACKDIILKVKLDLSGIFPYYVVAKFLPPKQLSCLINEFKKYKLFVENITKEKDNIYPEKEIVIKPRFDKVTDRILRALSICQESCGRISSNIKDYYNNDDEYAEHLNNFLKENVKNKVSPFTPEKLKKELGDSFADDENFKPKVQIERARMYGLEHVLKNCYIKYPISCTDIDNFKYVKKLNKDTADYVNNDGKENYTVKFKSKEEIELWKQYQWAKNKVELNWITDLSDIVTDIFSQMISWCYKFERDITYFVCALSYLTSDSETLACNMKQACDMFKYPTEETNKVKTNSKISPIFNKRLDCYFNNHNNLKNLFISLFKLSNNNPNNKSDKLNLYDEFLFRDSIDHFDFFKNNGKSLLYYYNSCYRFVDYDIKLKHNVYPKIIKLLERNKIAAKVCFKKEYPVKFGFESMNADYYLEDNTPEKHKVHSREFIKMVEFILNNR